MIPLVINHLMSTCFRGRSRSGDPEGSTNLARAFREPRPIQCDFKSCGAEDTGALIAEDALINEGRSASCSTLFKQSHEVVSQTSKREQSGW